MRGQSFSKTISVEGAIGQKIIGSQVFDEVGNAAQIVGLTWQQPKVDEVAKRVCERQNLRRDTTSRALIAWPADAGRGL